MNYDKDPAASRMFAKLWEIHKEIERMPTKDKLDKQSKKDASLAFTWTITDNVNAEFVACLSAKSLLRLCFLAKTYRVNGRSVFELLASITEKYEKKPA